MAAAAVVLALAAQRWAEQLATDAVERTLVATHFSQDAVHYACSRAAELTVATQHQARHVT